MIVHDRTRLIGYLTLYFIGLHTLVTGLSRNKASGKMIKTRLALLLLLAPLFVFADDFSHYDFHDYARYVNKDDYRCVEDNFRYQDIDDEEHSLQKLLCKICLYKVNRAENIMFARQQGVSRTAAMQQAGSEFDKYMINDAYQSLVDIGNEQAEVRAGVFSLKYQHACFDVLLATRSPFHITRYLTLD